jgi:hypothetical protein
MRRPWLLGALCGEIAEASGKREESSKQMAGGLVAVGQRGLIDKGVADVLCGQQHVTGEGLCGWVRSAATTR